ncbi:transcriptional regulator [Sporanaerobium hydrogeniformans]|uniref:Transcriptional regulator n=1 Tax=Sporanaerobium hydrogeniformans TaxID=3072179 RepID=A0AC61DBT9_9FIRM|nr:helix-turn-helix transcriptional regulator [Sporanaerobium hydrogeniformans]PHV70710.1 transcriptional regulator [Sporanaerobium hydrogeniformans]
MQNKINKLMEDYYVTFGELAMRLGISKQTLTRKLKGTTDWTYAEMILLAQVFNIEDIEEFFFGGN